MNEVIKRMICLIFHTGNCKKMDIVDIALYEYKCRKCGIRWFIYY